MGVITHMRFMVLLLLVALESSYVRAQQLEVTLNNTSKAYRLELYSWFPSKENTSAVSTSITNASATLNLETVTEGIYTLYAIDQNGIGKAPFIDVIITNDDAKLYWNMSNGWFQFLDSKPNVALHEYRNTYTELFKASQFYKEQLKVTEEEASRFAFKKHLETIQTKRETLFKTIRKNKQVWDDYLIYNHAYINSSALKFETFWDAFPFQNQKIYHTPFVSNVVNQLRQLLSQKYRGQKQLVDESLVEQLVENFGKTQEGLRYLEHWLYANYNTNQHNNTFVKGLALLSQKLPDNKIIAEDLKHFSQFQSGKTLAIDELNVFFKDAKDHKPHTIVFMSNNCGYCHDLLNRLNKNYNQPVLAISVLKDSENTIAELKAQYNNILFAFPDNIKGLKETYARRGTPTSYTVYKDNSKWYIQ